MTFTTPAARRVPSLPLRLALLACLSATLGAAAQQPAQQPALKPAPAAPAAPAAAPAPRLAAAPPRPLILTLQPGPLKQSADIDHGSGVLDVTMTIPDVQAAAGQSLLWLPRVVANVETVAATLKELVARDSFGEVPLAFEDQPGPHGLVRRWRATRDVQGDLVLHYQAPIDNTPPPRGSAPPYSLRTEGGGFSGVGNVFLLLPDGERPYPLALRWDLSRLGEGASATSSYGEGDLTLPSGAPARLWSTIFMAGPMRREPAVVSPKGFSSAWLGTPPFEPAPLMAWGAQLHRWMAGFFGQGEEAAPPYRVFLRYNPINAGGGTALTQSFLITHGKGIAVDDLKVTLSHEMAHTWINGADAAWYDEGLAVHYQALAPFRAGLFTSAQFLADLNQTAARYYANPLNTTPDAELMPRFWEDTRIRSLPYDRGAMYFALVDARVRKASGGQRSLDDLVKEMNRHSGASEAESEARWRKLLTQELGEAGAALHAAMLAGQLMVPESGDFGPCFKRTSKQVRRFELGFEPKSLVGDIKLIRGLQAGSAADKAGLRNGDVVTYAVAMDRIQGQQDSKLTLNVTRAGHSFTLSYLPRGERVSVWQWQRLPAVADSACGL